MRRRRFMTGMRSLTALFSLAVFVSSAGSAEAFKLVFNPRTTFNYCFDSDIGATQQARFADAVSTWQARASVSAAEADCPDSSALDIHKEAIDGLNNVLATTTFNILGNPVEITFDQAEDWWNSQSGTVPCNQVDYWGIAAHEIGHVWGVDHTNPGSGSPQGEQITMVATVTTQACPAADQSKYHRDLSSDDEAAIRYITTGQYLPATSLELANDCVSTFECVSAQYWTLSGAASRICGDGNAYHGSCYVKFTGTGQVSQRVRILDLTQADIAFRVQNRGSSSTSMRVIVKNVTDALTYLNTTCTVAAGSWRECAFDNYIPGFVSGYKLYEFTIKKEVANPNVWLDYIRGTGGVG